VTARENEFFDKHLKILMTGEYLNCACSSPVTFTLSFLTSPFSSMEYKTFPPA